MQFKESTAYTLGLKTGVYEESLKRFGTRKECDYLFSNFSNDLKKKYGK